MSSSKMSPPPVAPVKPSSLQSSKDKEPVFSEGENVFCFHGNLLYEARVQAIDDAQETPKYLIHYMGWNTKWDEWVDSSRVLKYTERNLERKKSLSKAKVSRKVAPKKKTEASATHSSKSEGQTSSRAKHKVPTGGQSSLNDPSASGAESESGGTQSWDDPEHGEFHSEDPTVDQHSEKIDVRIKIPEELHSYLIDDWDYVTRQKKLVKLPARITVEQILNDYLKSKSTKSLNCKANALEAAAVDVTRGLTENFNVLLGSQLLYKFETDQFADYVKSHEDVPLIQIYGAIHFLRLFVKLGSVLSRTTLSASARSLAVYHVNDFLSYMKKNASSLFKVEDYITCPPEYDRSSN